MGYASHGYSHGTLNRVLNDTIYESNDNVVGGTGNSFRGSLIPRPTFVGGKAAIQSASRGKEVVRGRMNSVVVN